VIDIRTAHAVRSIQLSPPMPLASANLDAFIIDDAQILGRPRLLPRPHSA
jgi:hypothetical protein